MAVIYITGGARSGKSSFAEARARGFGEHVVYMATGRASDEEMAERIRRHRASRPAAWRTVEAVEGLHRALGEADECALLDCVTNLVANRMLDMDADWDHPREEDIMAAERGAIAELNALIDRARARNVELILVSNELGMGLVPVYPFGRVFRDIAGRINQHLAARADEAYLLVSGIPLRLK